MLVNKNLKKGLNGFAKCHQVWATGGITKIITSFDHIVEKFTQWVSLYDK